MGDLSWGLIEMVKGIYVMSSVERLTLHMNGKA